MNHAIDLKRTIENLKLRGAPSNAIRIIIIISFPFLRSLWGKCVNLMQSRALLIQSFAFNFPRDAFDAAFGIRDDGTEDSFIHSL